VDWTTAIHEAGHAEVANQLGWQVTENLIGPITQAQPSPDASRAQVMAYYAAGHLAERIDSGAPTDSAFDQLLRDFFDRLGDDDVLSTDAYGIGQVLGDDVYELGQLIETSETREQGWSEFRQGRSDAVRLLSEQWGKVEQRARALQEASNGDPG
jgi:hypothetical protein